MFISPACYTHMYRTFNAQNKVITKTVKQPIVYADTVLNLKDLGSNIKVTTISNVSKFSLETCLEYVFNENPDVAFNTVQYSESTATVYFYADKSISTYSWLKRNCLKSVPLATSNSIIQEINRIINWPKITDRDIVSIDTVNKLIRQRIAKYKKLEATTKHKLFSVLKHKFDDGILISFHGFDYKSYMLDFSFRRYDWIEWDNFIIKKSNTNDFYMSKASGLYKDEVWCAICPILSEIYNDFLKFESLFKEKKYNTPSINSNFVLDIDRYGIEVFTKDFTLSSMTYSKNYTIKCNSSNVITSLNGHEQTLFENIYIKIDTCPNWMQEELYFIRQQELSPKNSNPQKNTKPHWFNRIFSSRLKFK